MLSAFAGLLRVLACVSNATAVHLFGFNWSAKHYFTHQMQVTAVRKASCCWMAVSKFKTKTACPGTRGRARTLPEMLATVQGRDLQIPRHRFSCIGERPENGCTTREGCDRVLTLPTPRNGRWRSWWCSVWASVLS